MVMFKYSDKFLCTERFMNKFFGFNSRQSRENHLTSQMRIQLITCLKIAKREWNKAYNHCVHRKRNILYSDKSYGIIELRITFTEERIMRGLELI